MSVHIPLVNAPIGSSGFNFTPDQFPRWVAFIAAQLEALSPGSGSGFNPLITGYGRITGADYFGADLTAPRLPWSPALALEIPNATWLVEDRTIAIDEPGGFLLLGDIPANMAGKFGYASALEIEDSGGEFTLEILPGNWFDALQPQLSAAGLVCIGKVTTDADSVTAIDGTDADVIVPLAVFLRQIRLLGGNGDSEEPATGEVSRTEFNALKAALDAQTTQIESLAARLGVPGLSGVVDDVNRDEAVSLMRVEAALTRLDPGFAQESASTIIIGGIAGDGYDLGNGVLSRDAHSGTTSLDLDTGEES